MNNILVILILPLAMTLTGSDQTAKIELREIPQEFSEFSTPLKQGFHKIINWEGKRFFIHARPNRKMASREKNFPAPNAFPSPSAIAEPSPSIDPTPSPSPTPGILPTPTLMPTPTPSASPKPTITPTPTPSISPTSTPSSTPNVALTASEIISLTNAARNENGSLAPLSEDSTLNKVAEARLKDMFQKQYFAHTSPSGVQPWDWATQFGYQYESFGENLAMGTYSSSANMVNAWMNSPGHRANILSTKYTEIGVAVGQGMFDGKKIWIGVQSFGTQQ